MTERTTSHKNDGRNYQVCFSQPGILPRCTRASLPFASTATTAAAPAANTEPFLPPNVAVPSHPLDGSDGGADSLYSQPCCMTLLWYLALVCPMTENKPRVRDTFLSLYTDREIPDALSSVTVPWAKRASSSPTQPTSSPPNTSRPSSITMPSPSCESYPSLTTSCPRHDLSSAFQLRRPFAHWWGVCLSKAVTAMKVAGRRSSTKGPVPPAPSCR